MFISFSKKNFQISVFENATATCHVL